MEQVINGKHYDTKTADHICGYCNGLDISNFENLNFELYRTKKGSYFAAGHGGANTMFSQPCSDARCGGKGIVPLSANEALGYAESSNSSADSNTIKKYFNIEEA